MQNVLVTPINESELEVIFNVDSSEVNLKFEKFFKSITPNVQIDGFRKGKVPIEKIRSMFASQARPQVSGDILKENTATQQISTRIPKPACADFVDTNKSSSQHQDSDN
jgi:FKBP-type peptidyl-prolyl cis-trans isomerase (trigger factor)